jgi:hypothetical protein
LAAAGSLSTRNFRRDSRDNEGVEEHLPCAVAFTQFFRTTAGQFVGAKYLQQLSAFGASDDSKAPICLMHYQVEKEMQESGMD